jgi:hypothetical protein
MKRKISKAEYDALSPEMKLLYVAEGADTFVLPLADYVDPGPIERARDRERDAATQLRTDLATANAELVTLRASTPKDVQTLTRAHNEALTTAKTEAETRVNALRANYESLLISTSANDIATALTATPENANVIKPHVNARLTVVWDGDVPTVKVKNTDGTVGSALTPDTAKTLQNNFVDNPVFAAIVVKSKASGGGATGQRSETSPGRAGKKFSELTEAQRVELYRESPDEYRKLKAAEGQ